MGPNCRDKIVSERYVDFLWKEILSQEELEERYAGICVQAINSVYAGFYVSEEFLQRLPRIEYPYGVYPTLYGLLQTENLEAANILRLQNQPVLQLKGNGVIIGLIDTGIDYRNDCFRDSAGKSRIVEIWDQTIQSGPLPEGIGYGSVYGRDEINQALNSQDPLSFVPSMDSVGHGTKLAAIAAGSPVEGSDWTGAAPMAQLAVVKLKPAKEYLKRYFAVKPDADAYQENDIMLGIRYLDELARREGKPLVICLGLGTNMGGHSGTSPLAGYLNSIGVRPGRCVVTAGGNEADQNHHFQGNLMKTGNYQDVELRVAENEYGLMMELWSSTPDTLGISIQSPTGEEIPRISSEDGNRRYDFLFEETVLYVEFIPLEARSGDQLIVVRMFSPAAGIWRFRVFGNSIVNGVYNGWLPVRGFLSGETGFLKSNPDITLTEPSNSEIPVTVGAYQVSNNSIYLSSGRGYTRNGRVKPDLVAPGVAVAAFGPGNREAVLSGTSASAAITAGAAALLMEWGVARGNRPEMSSLEIRQLFVRGADRALNQEYPNRVWGYGTLNLYESFEALGRFS